LDFAAKPHLREGRLQMILAACVLLTIALFTYVFYPEHNLQAQHVKTRLDFLQEQKDVLYENLRDLNFEYRAGKYPEEDYTAQRAQLESEAAHLLDEIDHLQASALHPSPRS
jgi:predicted nuclease with TOPRIM domain